MAVFGGEAKGELVGLRNFLDSNEEKERKNAAKRVIALMRSGENVSCLFSSMLRCVRTSDIELKKLSYLYLVTYSSSEPEQSIMAVNMFIIDSQDPNPLVRALAVRTMCRIKLDLVAEHMVLPLKKCLVDIEPYVRKTAALAVAKLYEVIPDTVENAQLFPELLKLLKDENPMVVSNATAALFEINERRTSPVFILDENTVTPIISAFTQCSGWVQSVLLDALSKYNPSDSTEAEFLIERLIPFLKHANASVVIGSFRCIFHYLDKVEKNLQTFFASIIPPFITLVSTGDPEIQYVVLRTLSLFVFKHPTVLSQEIRVFFCKYNDPSYIKLEKLNIINTITSNKNIHLVIGELEEYCNSVDVAFVKKTIDTIGKIAIRIESSARKCVDILVKLVESKAAYAVEESIIVLADVLRKFPGEFESVIGILCKNLEDIKEAKAKCAAIWILGEYCHIIERVDLLLDPYLDTYNDEPPEVQNHLLTAFVKIYTNNPDESRDQLQFILTESIKETVLPDVRNRALIYWRLLSTDNNESTKNIVVFPAAPPNQSSAQFSNDVLDILIQNMGTVSGVLHVVPSDFVKMIKSNPEEEDIDSNEDIEITEWSTVTCSDPTITLFVNWQKDSIGLKVFNKRQEVLSNFAVALNKNFCGLTISNNISFPQQLEYNDSFEVKLPVSFVEDHCANFESSHLQFAFRANNDTIMFTVNFDIPFLARMFCDGINGISFPMKWNQLLHEYTLTLKGSLADQSQINTRGGFSSLESNFVSHIMFMMSKNDIVLAKALQNGENIDINVKCSPSCYNTLVASASSMFCS